MEIIPMTFKNACAFVVEHHRHHEPPQGHKFSIGLVDNEKLVGVAIVGRPIARGYDNGFTLEVTRCCADGTKNASSKLYAAAWRAARALGYRRLITYTLVTEPGTSLRAAGWKVVGKVKGRKWVHVAPRKNTHPLIDKICWESKTAATW